MGWSEYGDWTSPDTLRLNPYLKSSKDPCGCLEAIVRAVNNRISGLRQLDSVFPLTEIFCDESGELDLRLVPVAQICQQLDQTIPVLVGYFVNHLDNDGNWDALPDVSLVAPYWTLESMLSAIGHDEILVVENNAPVTVEWVHQKYLIIKNLRWVKLLSSIDASIQNYRGISGMLVSYDYGYGLEGGYQVGGWPDLATPAAIALGLWNSAAWVNDVFTTFPQAKMNVYFEGSRPLGEIVFPFFYYQMFRKVSSIKLESFWPTPLEVNFYIRNDNMGQYPPLTAEELGYAESTQGNSLLAFSGQVDFTTGNFLVEIGKFETAPFWPPIATGVNPSDPYVKDENDLNVRFTFLKDVNGTYRDCVVKMDGENGFDFLDN